MNELTATEIQELQRQAEELRQLREGELDDVHTGESRAPKFNPVTHRATITPLPDGDQMINIFPADQPDPPGSRVIEPVE